MKRIDGRLARLERMVVEESKYYYYPPPDEHATLAERIIYANEQEHKAKALGKIARPFGYVENDETDIAGEGEMEL